MHLQRVAYISNTRATGENLILHTTLNRRASLFIAAGRSARRDRRAPRHETDWSGMCCDLSVAKLAGQTTVEPNWNRVMSHRGRFWNREFEFMGIVMSEGGAGVKAADIS
jgi:hypothetical protein